MDELEIPGADAAGFTEDTVEDLKCLATGGGCTDVVTEGPPDRQIEDEFAFRDDTTLTGGLAQGLGPRG